MASLVPRKLKSGKGWRIDYRLDGKHCSEYLPPGTPAPIAAQYLALIEERLLNLKLRGVPFVSPLKDHHPPESGIFLSAFIDKYLDFSRSTKAENTFLLDRHSLRLFLAFSGERQTINVTLKDAQGYMIHRLKSIKPVSVNVELRQLKAAFSMAVKWDYMKENPFKDIKQIKIKNQNFQKFFSKGDIKKLLDRIPPGRFRALIQFYLFTGCRRDEALNLTWDDIDLDRGTVHFTKTKSGSSRAVPLNGEIIDILKALDRTGAPFPFKRWFVSHKFKEYLTAAGLSPALHLHSLRHTFASHLVMEGVNILAVSQLLGHASIRETEKYSHLVPDHLKAATDRISY